MGENTYSLTVFLMKEHVKLFEQCIKSDKEVEYRFLDEKRNVDGVIVISKSLARRPAWLNFLEYFSREKILLSENVSNKAVMLIRIENHIFALTFGHGRAFLKEECIVKDFGFKTAINMLDVNKIRSVNAATIEDMVLHTQKQSSYATGQEEFSLNTLNDIMTSIVGKSKNSMWANFVSGKDSLLVSVEMIPEELVEKLKYYLDAYNADTYKKNGFGWVDNVREVRDIETKRELEKLLIGKIQRKESDNIFLSPAETVDWNSTKGFMLTGTGKRIDNPKNYRPDLDIMDYLVNLEPDVKLEKIKHDKVMVLDLNEENYPMSSVYAAIVAQIEYNEELYILCNASWFKIETNFYKYVRNFVASIPISSIEFPTCGKEEFEEDYNERIGKAVNFVHMDQKMVGVNNGPRKVESCDIFTRDKQFIHIKNRSSSGQLSHLFSQGRVSAECFIGDKEFRKQVYNLVKIKLGKDIFDYKKKPTSEEFEVIYAILSNKVGPVEDNLPFFSLVNLMLAVQELDRMHMKYSVKMILKE